MSSLNSNASSSRSSISSLVSPPSIPGNPFTNLPSPSLSSPSDIDDRFPPSFGFPPPTPSPSNEIASQLKAFTFGTCPTVLAPPAGFVGTPTAEFGPFEYPGTVAEGIEPPPNRRSSTTGTIMTVPVAGRRPSVLHSSTAPPDSLTVVLDAEESVTVPMQASSRRRQSIMFSQRGPPVVGPIPPSLLKFERRRGSLPISSLFPQPLFPQPQSYTTTTVDLYARRNSSISSAGGSSKTATATSSPLTRRLSLTSNTSSEPPQSYFALRRQSVPRNLHSTLDHSDPSSPGPSVRRLSATPPRNSMSLHERRAIRIMARNSVSTPNPFVSSGSDDDLLEEEKRPALETVVSDGDGSTPTGSAETTTTISDVKRDKGEVEGDLDPGAGEVEVEEIETGTSLVTAKEASSHVRV